jgi:hypothetical protein
LRTAAKIELILKDTANFGLQKRTPQYKTSKSSKNQ